MKFIMTIDPSTTYRLEVVNKVESMYGGGSFSVTLREERTHTHGFKKSDMRTVMRRRSPACTTLLVIQLLNKLYGEVVDYGPNTNMPLIEIKSYYNKGGVIRSRAFRL